MNYGIYTNGAKMVVIIMESDELLTVYDCLDKYKVIKTFAGEKAYRPCKVYIKEEGLHEINKALLVKYEECRNTIAARLQNATDSHYVSFKIIPIALSYARAVADFVKLPTGPERTWLIYELVESVSQGAFMPYGKILKDEYVFDAYELRNRFKQKMYKKFKAYLSQT